MTLARVCSGRSRCPHGWVLRRTQHHRQRPGRPGARARRGLPQLDRWSPWEDIDPALRAPTAGPTKGVGARYAWSGNRKAGAGSMEITGPTPRTSTSPAFPQAVQVDQPDPVLLRPERRRPPGTLGDDRRADRDDGGVRQVHEHGQADRARLREGPGPAQGRRRGDARPRLSERHTKWSLEQPTRMTSCETSYELVVRTTRTSTSRATSYELVARATRTYDVRPRDGQPHTYWVVEQRAKRAAGGDHAAAARRTLVRCSTPQSGCSCSCAPGCRSRSTWPTASSAPGSCSGLSASGCSQAGAQADETSSPV